MRRAVRIQASILLALAVVFVAAGCGGGQSAQQGGGAASKGRGDIKISVVTHGQASDPFWSVVKNGVDQASKDMGVDVKYSAPDTFDMVKMSQLIDAAVASKPDGLAVSVPDPDALKDSIKKATDAGIPVVTLNSGADVSKQLGALTHVGQTEFKAGVGAGEQLAKAGVDNALCINQEVGNAALDQRCDGFEKGLGGPVKVISVDLNDPTDAQAKIQTAINQNSDANGMLTLGPTGAEPALKALDKSGKAKDMKLATFDLSPAVLEAVRDGKLVFAVDQQQYLQGYLPIVFLTNYAQYGVIPKSEVLTGPAFVTKDNAKQVISLSKKGIR
ncbi:MAG TPA: sugar ABC transporter substrate-binding protein [Rubrobacteraceae bacterium]|nr:sugar ABC transporter substrate-binding protein [Rubrobacteraceae bacterium]